VFYCCSKTFESIEKENVKTWRFYRISVIMEYKKKPCLAPPFIIFGHVWKLCRLVYRRCTNQS